MPDAPQTIEDEFRAFNRGYRSVHVTGPLIDAPREPSQTPSFTTVLATVWKVVMAVLLIGFLALVAWAYLTA